MDLLAIYMEHIHPQFPSPRDDYLFLQTSGKRFTEKQQSNSAEQAPSTSHQQPLSNAVNRADAVADMQPRNADKNGQGTSREQPVDEHMNKGDAAVDKQTSNSVEIHSSKSSGTLPSST